MQVTDLPAKQKRLKDLFEFVNSSLKDSKFRDEFLLALKNYKDALLRCWESRCESIEDNARLEALDRVLNQLHNDARLYAGLSQ